MIYYSTIFLNFIFKSKKLRNKFNCMLFISYVIYLYRGYNVVIYLIKKIFWGKYFMYEL